MKKEIVETIRGPFGATDLRALRKTMNQNQTEFWQRFGVTQSCGSRFEKGSGIPPSVAILIALYMKKKISDSDLLTATRGMDAIGAADVADAAEAGGRMRWGAARQRKKTRRERSAVP